MKNVLIFGSGSIGNHLANASRKLGLSVNVTDISDKALLRMKIKFTPFRYLKWDNKIELINYKKIFKLKKFDLIIIGTPPSSHYDLIKKIFKHISFDKLMIEKPFQLIKIQLDKKI